jgi:1A family penicillin-binding protein
MAWLPASLRARLPSTPEGGWRGALVQSATAPRVLRLVLFVYLILATVCLVWVSRYSLSIYRLREGVGNTTFFTADGRPWFRLEEHRRDVPLAQISPHLREAVIAVEDHRFYRHMGIDPMGFARAVWMNVRHTGMVEGGSTLTQQLARTLFLSNEKSFIRKGKEAVIALMLENQLRKDQILELYLNRIYLSGGVYGVEAMSRSLFAKPARDLNLAESALIAGVIRAPSALSPWSNFEGALARSEVVLARMREEKVITEQEHQVALKARFRMTASPGLLDARSGYAKEYLRQVFREQVGEENPAGWKVRTTFMPAVQQAAERSVAEGLARLGRPKLQAALVAIDPRTGDILALVGGRDFSSSAFNRAVKSRRQPGSAFKPFVYAAALERGYSPVSLLHDLTSVSAPGKQEWTPRNAEHTLVEESTLREALLESNNQAAVRMQMEVGSGRVLDLAERLSLRDLPNVPSLALGTGLVTPLALTTAYAVFPSGGMALSPRPIVRILDGDDTVVVDNPVKRERALSPEAAFQTLSMLQDVIEQGTGSSARSQGVTFPAGGKTGTTNEFKDAWFVGFTSEVVAGVWVGYDQPEPIGGEAYAARVALPIWSDFMRRTARVLRPQAFEMPAGLRETELCRVSYLRPVNGCPTYVEFFKEGDGVPGRLCPLHEGSLKQEVRRAIDGLAGRIGRALRDIFK